MRRVFRSASCQTAPLSTEMLHIGNMGARSLPLHLNATGNQWKIGFLGVRIQQFRLSR